MTRLLLIVLALLGAGMLMTSFPRESRERKAAIFLLAFAVSSAMSGLW